MHTWPALILTSFTLFFGFILSSSATTADTTTSASVSVNVAAACTFDAVEDTPHSATIPAGTYKSEIGSTNFTIVCNDTEGYSIYAIGYSNQEFGNNKLLANINGSSNSTYDINTGINTSGSPSSWAMKLIPGTGLTSSNILNGYGSYSIIPNQYVKVASLVPATNSATNNTSVLSATYAVNIAGTQPAGTYNGKVKYTMVHPSSAVPNRPYDCDANKICYSPNGNGSVTDTMGDQSITASATSATLWASNFKRDGYGFAGWSDKFDWVVNANDINGNGTGPNEGYHIYGPNQDINFTAGQYSGTNKGLSLYAVWVKSQGNLQNWNGCGAMNMNIGEVTALTDKRDNNTYAVAKLRDGKCWMVENLRLSYKNQNDIPITLTSENTNNPVASFMLSVSQNPSTAPWCGEDNAVCTDQSMFFANIPVSNMTHNADALFSYGNYYNWYSATAGWGRYEMNMSNSSGSICPYRWHLPTGKSEGEFATLDIAMGGTGSLQHNSEASNRWRSYPQNFNLGGRIEKTLFFTNSAGYYWSATPFNGSSIYAGSLRFSHYFVSPAPISQVEHKYLGSSVRCVTSL